MRRSAMPSAADPRWERLTRPAKAVWRWAWATASARTGAAEPSNARVDTIDLLAGLALAQLHDNPVSQLLTHFSIPPGALLGDGGARRYQADAVLAAFRRLPDGALPEIDEQAGQILDYARTVMPPSPDGLVTLSMVLAALLETPNRASMALRTELGNRGVDVELILKSCREHLGGRSSYAEYLRDHHPYRPPEVQLPPYVPDEPRTRNPPRQATAEPPDLVGITAEVDSFAYLIAAKTLTPPLAVGLFGDWGSGKSYFLRSVQRRIDQLVSTDADGRSPFHRKIAQVEFNAWQYVEGNLWASLLEHLFRNLRLAGEHDSDDLLDARRNEYLTKITECTAEHRRAVQQHDALAAEQQQAQRTVESKIEERDATLAELGQARLRNPLRGWMPSTELSRTLAEVGIDTQGIQVDMLRHNLASIGETVRRAGPVLGALRVGGWRYALALIILIGFGPLVSVILVGLDRVGVLSVITSVSVFLGGVTAYLARGNAVVAGALDAIGRAQAQFDAELGLRRTRFDQQIRQAETELADRERELSAAFAKAQRLTASVEELEAQLARVTPSSVLADFIDDRFASDDYRRHLGVPALVRQDLERLSRLLQQHHDPTQPPAIEEQHAIDRVVLYIDDLDRCPTDVVIKVLEAVHLLLAFPLFVVVVAVDARWLESSLRTHYTQLKADAAVPADYLEKIFQVPFWVRPLGADPRRQMVRGLLTPNLAGAAPVTDDAAGPAAEADVSDADLPEFTRLVESFEVTDLGQVPWPQTARLTVTAAELALVEDLSALIGPTPRAVKRFINVYLLLTSMGRSRGWSLPEQGQVAMLLAVATGLPDLAGELLPSLAVRAGPVTLRAGSVDTASIDTASIDTVSIDTVSIDTVSIDTASIDTAGQEVMRGQLARLNAWLTEHPSWCDVDLSGAGHWIDLILRFRFDRVPARDGPLRTPSAGAAACTRGGRVLNTVLALEAFECQCSNPSYTQ